MKLFDKPNDNASWCPVRLVSLAFVLVAGLLVGPATLAETMTQTRFDHLTTGFPLTGAHASTPCESCHVRGVFRGTPRECEQCHNPATRIADGKPPNHVPTQLPCDQCHRSTTSWLVVRFQHIGIAPGTCASCHNGRTASGKPANHIPTNMSCDSCHRTTAWVPAMGFDHTGVAPGSCAMCHNGSRAAGKPAGHFITTQPCDACHTTRAWVPVNRYTHTSPYYQPHNAGVTCASCHTTNSEVIAWKYSAYKPDCAGCHAGQFSAGSHTKTTTPTRINYTVAELRNCAGACHIYTDNTFTTIKTTRSGQHRSTDGGF